MIPRIESAEYVSDYMIHLRFTDGAEGDVDLGSVCFVSGCMRGTPHRLSRVICGGSDGSGTAVIVERAGADHRQEDARPSVCQAA